MSDTPTNDLAPGPGLEALIAWAETQDPTTPYEYIDPSHCFAAQFRASRGESYSTASWLNETPLIEQPFAGLLELISATASHSYARRVSSYRCSTFGEAVALARHLRANLDRTPHELDL